MQHNRMGVRIRVRMMVRMIVRFRVRMAMRIKKGRGQRQEIKRDPPPQQDVTTRASGKIFPRDKCAL